MFHCCSFGVQRLKCKTEHGERKHISPRLQNVHIDFKKLWPGLLGSILFNIMSVAYGAYYNPARCLASPHLYMGAKGTTAEQPSCNYCPYFQLIYAHFI